MVQCVNFRRISAQKNGFLWRVLGALTDEGDAQVLLKLKKGPGKTLPSPNLSELNLVTSACNSASNSRSRR
jgi:hypothetical protein